MFFSVLLFLNISFCMAQVTPDEYPDIIDTASNFKLTVERHYKTPFELTLIIKSEESDAVKKFAERLHTKHEEEKQKMLEEGNEPIGHAELPAIVNGKLPVDFFAMIRHFQKGDFSDAQSIAMTSASLTYRADILQKKARTIIVNGKKKTLKNVIAVDSDLSWRHRCGTDCGLDYTEKRTVIFDAKGALLDVETASQSAPSVENH